MKDFKNLIGGTGVAVALFGASPAFAGDLSEDLANYAFEKTNRINATDQVQKLSDKEMKKTKGEFISRAISAVAGFGSGFLSAYDNGYSWGHAFTDGAAAGLYAGAGYYGGAVSITAGNYL